MASKFFPAKAVLVIANPKSKLLDQLREVLRVKHYSLRTEEAYVQWVRRYLKFHRLKDGDSQSSSLRGWRHPRELGPADVVAFLNHLANVECVAAGTQNQALNAISFLYTQVLRIELGGNVPRLNVAVQFQPRPPNPAGNQLAFALPFGAVNISNHISPFNLLVDSTFENTL